MMEEVMVEARACHRCPLYRTRMQPVLYRGPEHPRVAFVGQSPGAEEDRQGVPFIGPSGQLLQRMVDRWKMNTFSGFLNVVNCHPPENSFLLYYAEQCRPFLERKLGILSPNIIVTVGRDAEAAIEGLFLDIAGRKSDIPMFFSARRAYVHHPSFILRCGGEGGRMWVAWDRQFAELNTVLLDMREDLGL